MDKNKITLWLLFLLFSSLISIALVRTGYNFSKLVTEERQWYFLSYEEKRLKQFGDTYSLLKFVQNNTQKDSQILFFTDDLRTHYFGRYFLYPEKIIGEHEKHIWKPKADYYDYIVIYPANKKFLVTQAFAESNIKNYSLVKTYRGQSGQIGLLYKK